MLILTIIKSWSVPAPYENWFISKSDNPLPLGLSRKHIQDILERSLSSRLKIFFLPLHETKPGLNVLWLHLADSCMFWHEFVLLVSLFHWSSVMHTPIIAPLTMTKYHVGKTPRLFDFIWDNFKHRRAFWIFF